MREKLIEEFLAKSVVYSPEKKNRDEFPKEALGILLKEFMDKSMGHP